MPTTKSDAEEPVRTAQSKRLLRLLEFLGGMQPSEFARRAHVDQSTVSRIISGERAVKEGSAVLALGALLEFGIHPNYWTSPVELAPQDCQYRLVRRGEEGDVNMGMMVSMRTRLPWMLGAIAKEEGQPDAVVSAIVGLKIPAEKLTVDEVRRDGDIEWLFRECFRVMKSAGAKTRP